MIEKLTDAVKFLFSVLSHENDRQLTPEEQTWISSSFPLILVYEGAKLKKFQYALRSEEPLQLGTDITTIATDDNYIVLLKHYFEKHQVNINVVTLSSLDPATAKKSSEKAKAVDSNCSSV